MKRLLSLLTVVTFVAIPNYSFAQNSDLVLEEVVVTATKKEENVQDIAQQRVAERAAAGATVHDPAAGQAGGAQATRQQRVR